MTAIEIDFDVFKALTLARQSESDSYNAVLRRMLKLGDPVLGEFTSMDDGCIMQGVHFPEGTEFRVVYKGRTHNASIKDGRWIDSQGRPRRSPSDAAVSITGNNVNGWRFWSFRRPGEAGWRKLRELQQ